MQTPKDKLSSIFGMLGGRGKDSSYRQEPLDGGRIRFIVTAAAVPKSTFGPRGVGICIGLFTFFMMNAKMGRNAIIAGAVAYAITKYLLDRLWELNVNFTRVRGGAFVVSPAGIEHEGTIVPSGQINLILRNSAPAARNSGVLYDSRSLSQGLGAAAAEAKMVNSGIAASVSFNLCLETGGKSDILAGGMTHSTAYGLLSDTARILGLTVRS